MPLGTATASGSRADFFGCLKKIKFSNAGDCHGDGGIQSLAAMSTRTAPWANFCIREIETKRHTGSRMAKAVRFLREKICGGKEPCPMPAQKIRFQMTPD
jgi:hypothetical protein